LWSSGDISTLGSDGDREAPAFEQTPPNVSSTLTTSTMKIIIFGERQEWQGERAKFPPTITHKVIRSRETGEPIRIWGDGSQVRTFLYIDDAVGKVFEIMNTEDYWGEVNVASDEQVTVKQCADWLCEIAGVEPHYIFEADKPVGVNARGIDNSKFYSHYKYRNKFTTKQGFEKLYQWMTKKLYAQN